MKTILGLRLSPSFLWPFLILSMATYLILNPPLSHPQSTAFALGAGLLFTLLGQIFSRQTLALGPWAWAFLGYCLLSFAWSCQPGLSLVASGFLFLAVLLFLSQSGGEKTVQSAIEMGGLFLALAASLMALQQRLIGLPDLAQVLPDLSGEERGVVEAAIHNQRAFGPLVTPGALAAFIIFFLPQAYIRFQITKGATKCFFGSAIILLLAGLWTTQSVGAWVSLTLAVLVILALRRSWRSLGVALLVGLSGAVYFIAQRSLYSWHLAAFSMRLELWDKAWKLFLMKPFLGWGLGCFGEAYQNMGFDPHTGSRFAHNLPLQVLVELGGVGMTLFLLVLLSIIRRVRPQPRWEAWGVGTGFLSILFFSLVDLPFQMPELIVLFAVIAGRIELKGENQRPTRRHKDTKGNEDFEEGKNRVLPRRREETEMSLSAKANGLLGQKNIWGLSGVEWLLLGVFLVAGFWPPFRHWNFCLLAVTLWFLAGWNGPLRSRIPLWAFLGFLFFVVRSLLSPSDSGCVRFFQMAGILMAFSSIFPGLKNREKFLKGFGICGLVWAVKIWWETFHYNEGGLSGWIHFQFSDVKDWIIFPNPKQIALFLIPLLFLPLVLGKTGVFSRLSAWALGLGALATMIRLKSSGALLGFCAGLLGWVRKKSLPALLGIAAVLLILLVATRSSDSSSTRWGRFEIWGSAVKVFALSPIWGQGPGAFSGLYHLVKKPRVGGVSRYLMDARYAHNEALETLVAFGLVGFGFLLAILLRLWPGQQQVWNKTSLLGLGASSLTDFCLHTPLIALWGTAFLNFQEPDPGDSVGKEVEIPGFSLARGFLVLGMALGLFGPPCFIPALTEQFQVDLQANQLPHALRMAETAEKLDPWDNRHTLRTADFLENLYLATGDEIWKKRSDQAQEKAIEMESTDGSLRFEKAKRLTQRVHRWPTLDNQQAAQKAWDEADQAVPYDAFMKCEKALFCYDHGPGPAGKWSLENLDDGAKAFIYFRQAEELEPNYAQAWYYSGLCKKGMGDEKGVRDDFEKALQVYSRYRDALRIDDLEKLLVSLTPNQLNRISFELGRK